MSPDTRLGAFTAPDLPDIDGLRTCVHCGICLPQCPTYRVLGEEMDSPRGRIYLMRAAAEGRLDITETLTRHLDLCLGCRACETACPSGVPFGRLLEATRGQIERQRGPSGGRTRPWRQRALASFVLGLFPHPRRMAPVARALMAYQLSGLQRLVRGNALVARLPGLAAMERLLPMVPPPMPLPQFIPAVGRRRGRVGLLIGCVQRFLYPRLNAQTARVLAAAGYDVVIPETQGCCGALHLHAGRLDELRTFARALADAFPEDLDYIVTTAAGCGSTMKEYAHWMPDDSRVAGLAARTRDVSEVLADCDLPLGRLDVVVTYHDACHLAHGQKVRAAPRTLLEKIPGLTLVPLAESDLCCGSAGVYNLLEPEMADQLLERKVSRIAETGAAIVATGNPGCLMQIAKGCRERGVAVEVLHPVELIARALPDRGP